MTIKIKSMTIKIKSMTRSVSDGIVNFVQYEASKTVGEHTAKFTENVMLRQPTGTPVPFDKLTEAKIIEWVGGVISFERTEANLDAQLHAIANAVSATGLPWAG